MSLRAVGVILCALIAFASGVWLTRSGKPYRGLLLNVHKLISLAGVVLLALIIRQQSRASALSPANLVALVVTGLLLLTSIVTGGLASIDKPLPRVVLIAHRVAPFLSLVAAAASIYLLLGRP